MPPLINRHDRDYTLLSIVTATSPYPTYRPDSVTAHGCSAIFWHSSHLPVWHLPRSPVFAVLHHTPAFAADFGWRIFPLLRDRTIPMPTLDPIERAPRRQLEYIVTTRRTSPSTNSTVIHLARIWKRRLGQVLGRFCAIPAAHLFRLHRNPSNGNRGTAGRIAKIIQKRGCRAYRQFLGLCSEPDPREIKVRSTVDHIEPLAAGRHVGISDSARLPASFECFVSRSGRHQHWFPISRQASGGKIEPGPCGDMAT